MKQLIRTCIPFILALAAVSDVTGQAAQRWPLNEAIDLSSGFGDFRERRFHTGIDLRTGGRTGRAVVAPVDGYVWRVRAAYDGYGKALYLKGDDGFIYVLAHLERFAGPVQDYVAAEQVRRKRYTVDLSPPADSIRFKAGDFIGNSGQTGTGAPHLHFEKRTASNVAVNPLRNGFVLDDTTRPIFERIGFAQTDTVSLFENGRRKIYLDVSADSDGVYRPDRVMHFSTPFGVLADCYDRMRRGRMKQSPYLIQLSLDGNPVYSVRNDSLDFEWGIYSALEYDYREAVDNRNRVRRLYSISGNNFPSSRDHSPIGGLLGSDLTAGRHTITIVASDAFDNTSTLECDFLWTPDLPLFATDTAYRRDDSIVVGRFTRAPWYDSLNIASTSVEYDDKGEWKAPDTSVIRELADGTVEITASAHLMGKKAVRLVHLTDDGGRIEDYPFYGVGKRSTDKGYLTYEIVSDGVIVSMESTGYRHLKVHLLAREDGHALGASRATRFYNAKEYHIFVPALDRYRHIDQLQVFTWSDTSRNSTLQIPLDLYLVGDQADEIVFADSLLSVRFDTSQFFEPRFVELRANKLAKRFGDLNSDHYQIFPEAFATRADFEVSLRLLPMNRLQTQSGICWLDKEENRWVWLKDNVWNEETERLTASSRGGGDFAAVIDHEPPVIQSISIRQDQVVHQPRPMISFALFDKLSGFEDDRNISISLDGEWMIPEYDPEERTCFTRPLSDLEPGDHHLAIVVTDRAGNRAEQYRTFSVKPRTDQ